MKNQTLIRRAAVAITAGGLFLTGLATAQSAAADEVWAGTLTSGQAVTASISQANRQLSYVVPASKGEHLTISTSASTWSGNGTAKMSLYVPVPSGNDYRYVLFQEWFAASGQTPQFDTVPEAKGLWKLTVTPVNNATGSTTFTFAEDAQKILSEDAPSATGTTTVPGQNVVYWFRAKAADKLHVSLDVTALGLGTGGSAAAKVYSPSGTLVAQVPLTGPGNYDLVPDTDGWWKLVIDPVGAAVGSTSVTLAPDLLKGMLESGVAKPTEIKYRGQNAIFGLYGVAGQDLPVKVTNGSWGSGFAYLRLFAAGSDTQVGWCQLGNGNKDCLFHPPATGGYRLVLDPAGAAIGSATVTRLT